jgi:hypothetical protein
MAPPAKSDAWPEERAHAHDARRCCLPAVMPRP